ncbi:MAG TPA: ribosome small subunit-dependent GTPase A [Clostridiales bacterium]|nr:ribosome small subunit-dependent GTPase A [Clostridiales bacterium]
MTDIKEYGYIPNGENDEPIARVTAVDKERFELMHSSGALHGRLKALVYYAQGSDADFPTTGDFVEIVPNALGDSQIIRTLPRKSFFSRPDPMPGRRPQAVAANFDTVFILTSLNRDFNLRRLERYLALAWQSGAVPAVLLTKADLVQECREQCRAAEKIAGGAGVFAVSAKTGQGLDDLAPYLQPRRTLVFLGSSGVGKSSLVNALAGAEVMKVQSVRPGDSRGRHTTTRRQLMMLPSGVMVIDTPGLRQLGMHDAGEGLAQSFADIERLTASCRFGDCRHAGEPGCAVRAAIDSGELAPERWESYRKLTLENRQAHYFEDKSAALRERRARGKSIAKLSRRMKESGELRYE